MLFYPDGLGREKNEEMIRILYCKGISATIERGENGNWLILNHPCTHLIEENGEYSCALYDDPCRPSICARFPYDTTPDWDCPHIIPLSV
jgi:hypothetical protein